MNKRMNRRGVPSLYFDGYLKTGILFGLTLILILGGTSPVVAQSGGSDSAGNRTDTEEPRSLLEAVRSGQIDLLLRPRAEFVDAEGVRASQAVTNRLLLGYRSGSFHGLSGYVSFLNVHAFTPSTYNAAGLNDQPGRAVIADPEMVRLNQLYGQLELPFSESRLRAGRQRILLADTRFVGNVGWRQNEQIYNAVRLTSSLGLEHLEFDYAWLWKVHRPFGADHPAGVWDSDTHLLHLAYRFENLGNLALFGYRGSFDQAPERNSTTYGLRLDGTRPTGFREVSVLYDFYYAYQDASSDNPVDYSAHFYRAALHLEQDASIRLGVILERFGSDGGLASFQTPLATLHAFQGWADMFTTIPDAGLRDLSIAAGVPLPLSLYLNGRYHWFHEAFGNDPFGSELNLSLERSFGDRWHLLLKLADFRGEGPLPDTRKYWIQLQFQL